MAKCAQMFSGKFALWLGFYLAFAIVASEAIATYENVVRGNDVILACEAYKTIAPSVMPSSVMVEWSKFSIPLVESTGQTINGRFRLDTVNSNGLFISVVAMTDGGLYTCRAEGQTVVASSTSQPLLIETTQVSLTRAAILSEESNVTLSVEEPSPPGYPIARITTKNSINLSWIESNGPVLSYQVLYRKGVSTMEPGAALCAPVLPGVDTSLLVQNLEVYTDYSFWVEASYRGNYTKISGVSVFKTAPGTPTIAPQNVDAETRSATAIFVLWTAPPSTSLNGDIVGYRILFTSFDDQEVSVLFAGTSTSKLVENLLSYKNYSIKVAVLNNAMGEDALGPYSNEVYARTLEAAPSKPLGLRTITREEDEIMIFWFPPMFPNSAEVTYNAEFRKRGETQWQRAATSIAIQYHTFSGLEIYTEYEFRALAVNRIGEGEPSDVYRERTEVAAPSPPVNVTVTDIGPGQARVSWMRPEVYYKSVDSYTVTYWESGSNVTMEAVEVDKLWHILDDLKGSVQYVVKVQAATTTTQAVMEVKQGEPSELVFFTTGIIGHWMTE